MNMRVCGGGRCCLKGEEGVMCKRGIWVRRKNRWWWKRKSGWMRKGAHKWVV